MSILKVHKAFDKFLKDPNLSLRAKGFLTMVLTTDIGTGLDIEKYCTDSKEDIKDTLLELRINHYIRYNPEDNMLEADAVPYEEREKEQDDFEL
ncbi:MAG: hypothetical protein Q4E69_07085 [Bacilli bacterium]|nr:hypothetical protein [Bacilli bacterium]